MTKLDYSLSSGSYVELGVDYVLQEKPDLILFDLTPGEAEIIPLYQRLKNSSKLENLQLAILILASETSLSRIPISLELDDLVLVPYKTPELLLRIKRLLWQRDKLTDQELIKIADLTINPTRY